MDFYGYYRGNDRVGTRNHLAIIPTVFCANTVARRIAENIENAVLFTHGLGCGHPGIEQESTKELLSKIGGHPNFGGVLIVGLGCERISADDLANEICKEKKPVEIVVIQNEGDSIKAIEKGVTLSMDMISKISRQKREPADISNLILGVKCGGTDFTSGLASNPAVGITSDKIIKNGGSVVMTEITELIGAEHILKRMCINKDVAEKIDKVIAKNKNNLRAKVGICRISEEASLVSPGNREGGVTNVVEKALGGYKKAGSSVIQDVIEYGQNIEGKGLYIMDGPSHDGESVTGMIASGAQIIIFTTGRGTPTGFPGVPVIKVCGNPNISNIMKANIDADLSEIMNGTTTIKEGGEQLFERLVMYASGELTKAELLKHDELFCLPRLFNVQLNDIERFSLCDK